MTDLAWVENHVESPLARFMNFISSHHNTREAQDEQFKRELIRALATSPGPSPGRPGPSSCTGHVAAGRFVTAMRTSATRSSIETAAWVSATGS